MMKASLSVCLLACLAFNSNARRTKMADITKMSDPTEVAVSVLSWPGDRPQTTIQGFFEQARSYGPAGEAAGQLVANLEGGVLEAIVDATLETTGAGGERTVVLTVTHNQPMQGQISTPSKVPVKWALDTKVKWTLSQKLKLMAYIDNSVKLEVEGGDDESPNGLMLLPFSEGKDMYLASGVKHGDCTDLTPIIEKVKCERNAFWNYYSDGNTKTGWISYKTTAYLDARTHPDHKLGRILVGMYGSLDYYLIMAKGGGKDGWQQVLYSLVTIPPAKVVDFTFIPKGNNPDNVEMAMSQREITSGTYFGKSLGEYAGLDFAEKNAGEFDAKSFEWQRSAGEMFVNVWAMVAKGRDSSVNGGTAKYILKFARACLERSAEHYAEHYADRTYHDITDGCRDEHGRVLWSA